MQHTWSYLDIPAQLPLSSVYLWVGTYIVEISMETGARTAPEWQRECKNSELCLPE